MLLGSDAFFASHFSIGVMDSRKGTELEKSRQTSLVDDFVNDAMEANLGRFPEKPDQRLVHIAVVLGVIVVLVGLYCRTVHDDVVIIYRSYTVDRPGDPIFYILNDHAQRDAHIRVGITHPWDQNRSHKEAQDAEKGFFL